MAHLQTAFTVRRQKFLSTARKLVAISPQTIQSVADHLEKERPYSTLDKEQRTALDLLKHVKATGARTPSSQTSKIFARTEIWSYFGFFGLPHIYFTANPSPSHSPIFQLMFGDESVNLNERFPVLVPPRERAIRLAKDPVAAADFFHFSIIAIFKHLFGWDFDNECSSDEGGILGKLQAFYGSSEFTDWGSLHGHFLLWLLGGMNPQDLHAKLHDNKAFQKQFFEFFEDIIHCHLPEVDVDIPSGYEPRVECPPLPPSSTDDPIDILNAWDSVFVTEIKKCREVLQQHSCHNVCHKY